VFRRSQRVLVHVEFRLSIGYNQILKYDCRWSWNRNCESIPSCWGDDLPKLLGRSCQDTKYNWGLSMAPWLTCISTLAPLCSPLLFYPENVSRFSLRQNSLDSNPVSIALRMPRQPSHHNQLKRAQLSLTYKRSPDATIRFTDVYWHSHDGRDALVVLSVCECSLCRDVGMKNALCWNISDTIILSLCRHHAIIIRRMT
jgi:hypothetical protein